MKVRLVLTGRLTVLGFDLAWFSSLSSEHLCIFGLHGEGTGFDNVGHRLGLATRTQISVCKSPFLSAGTAVSLFRAKVVQQRPLLPREVETWLPDCGVTH